MYTQSSTEAIMGAAIGILVVILIIFFAIAILLVASNWKIFKKSGEEGWKALIPYYNTWTLCNIVGINPNWVFIIIGCSVLSMVPMLNIVGGLAAIYFQVLINVSLAKSFGKDTGFGIGLLLLPVIFYPILGFGKDQYVGKNPMQDMIFKNNIYFIKIIIYNNISFIFKVYANIYGKTSMMFATTSRCY